MRDKLPSATAYIIAQSLYALSRDPLTAHLIPIVTARFSEDVIRLRSSALFQLVTILTHRPLRFIQSVMERFTVPGIRLHYALRKCYIEEISRQALNANFQRVVVIGAGFDTLALRLSRDYPTFSFLEVDHPATQRSKTQAAAKADVLKTNIFFHPIDLTQTAIDKELLPTWFQLANAPTVFVVEGLLMYLNVAEIDYLLESIRQRSSRGSLLICTLMEPEPTGRLAFHNGSRVIDLWLHLRGESFRWGINRNQVAYFFSQRGFSLRSLVTDDDLRQLYLSDTDLKLRKLPYGEHICILESI